MATRNDVSFWRRVLEEMAGPEARQVRLLSRDLAKVTAERDRLLVALRSVHCELYEGTQDRALNIIDEALNGQQDGDPHE